MESRVAEEAISPDCPRARRFISPLPRLSSRHHSGRRLDLGLPCTLLCYLRRLTCLELSFRHLLGYHALFDEVVVVPLAPLYIDHTRRMLAVALYFTLLHFERVVACGALIWAPICAKVNPQARPP